MCDESWSETRGTPRGHKEKLITGSMFWWEKIVVDVRNTDSVITCLNETETFQHVSLSQQTVYTHAAAVVTCCGWDPDSRHHRSPTDGSLCSCEEDHRLLVTTSRSVEHFLLSAGWHLMGHQTMFSENFWILLLHHLSVCVHPAVMSQRSEGRSLWASALCGPVKPVLSLLRLIGLTG